MDEMEGLRKHATAPFTEEEQREMGIDVNGRFLNIPGPPLESFEHGAIEESDLDVVAIRGACLERLTTIAAKVVDVTLEVADYDGDRGALSSILANLNQAQLHVEDPFGC